MYVFFCVRLGSVSPLLSFNNEDKSISRRLEVWLTMIEYRESKLSTVVTGHARELHHMYEVCHVLAESSLFPASRGFREQLLC